MSRDLTPAEEYAFEQYLIKQGQGSLIDNMEETTITYAGKTSPLYSKESIENRRCFPLLGSLYTRFDELHSLLSKTEEGLKLLRQLEKELGSFIENSNKYKETYLTKWFKGELDTGFYYREENDRLFLEAVHDELTYCSQIDVSKITESARISVIWDSFGIAVDMNYSYDKNSGYGESVLCFCETYDDGTPNEEVRDEAQRIGEFLKEKYDIPLDINKDILSEFLLVDTYSIDNQNTIYTVSLEPNFVVDVKVCSEDGLVYVMQNGDGSTVYRETNNDITFPHYRYNEDSVIKFVKEEHQKRLIQTKPCLINQIQVAASRVSEKQTKTVCNKELSR